MREIDGEQITLYLSVGYALYSEYPDLDEQAKSAEMRLHADHNKNISAVSRIGHASELFYMFDDLPVPYAVLHVTYAEHSGRCDAELRALRLGAMDFIPKPYPDVEIVKARIARCIALTERR